MFTDFAKRFEDPLLAVTKRFKRDPRPGKINMGVGIYQNEKGETPVMHAVKQAEEWLLRHQKSKQYIGITGNEGFCDALLRFLLGTGNTAACTALQSVGGTGAVYLALRLFALARPAKRIWLGKPSWGNHLHILTMMGARYETFAHLDPCGENACIETVLKALERAEKHDAFLLHGGCHNPTGADYTPAQWHLIAEAMREKNIFPIIDMAYCGFIEEPEQDSAVLRLFAGQFPHWCFAFSCSKNFGLYRERTGALLLGAPQQDELAKMLGAAEKEIRATYSMPPDHGAAIVAHILASEELRSLWRDELVTYRRDITTKRTALAGADARLASIARQKGMFSLLPLSRDAADELEKKHALYIAPSGRINILGLPLHAAGEVASRLTALYPGQDSTICEQAQPQS